MCLSPVHIGNPSTYKVYWSSAKSYNVPCGHCDECRYSYEMEWQTRISYEIQHTYANHGCCIFLTFTYDDAYLPVYCDDEADLYVPCFSREHVLTTLNRIKVWANKKYGKHSYKYIWCSEYGKETQRPHYHALFFLTSSVDHIAFALKCRDAWQPLGFMFPKWDKYRECFVDNYGRPDDVLLRDKIGGSKYICKYVTKDLAFYGMPEVDSYLNCTDSFLRRERKEAMKPYLPKHWQSNELGYSIFDHIDISTDEKIDSLFNQGVYNTLTQEFNPLPRYAINKLMYRNVSTKGHYYERTSVTTSENVDISTGEIIIKSRTNYLFDRELTDFGRKYLRKMFDARLDRRCVKLSQFFQIMKQFDSFSYVLPVLRKLNISFDDYTTFYPLAVYHDVLCNYGYMPLRYYLGDNFDYTNRDNVFNLYNCSHDTDFLRTNNTTKVCRVPAPYGLFDDLRFLDSYYKCHSITLKTERIKKNKLRYDELQSLKRDLMSRYDLNFC